MRDVVFLVLVAAFFAAATAYVRGCAALVARDAIEVSPLTEDDGDDRAGATT